MYSFCSFCFVKSGGGGGCVFVIVFKSTFSPDFLGFKVGRGKAIGGLNLVILTEIVYYPILSLWRAEDYFN